MAAREHNTAEIVEETDLSAEVPPDVEFVLSAMEVGGHGRGNGRRADRAPYRTRALLKLFSEPSEADRMVLYTRDLCPRSLGFITRHRLPLGYGGIVEFVGRDGQKWKLECTLLRCREASAGWYEGAMYFNRTQKQFAANGAKNVDEGEPIRMRIGTIN